MNILVTGARAPISADIVRALVALGHRVWTSDSLTAPFGRFSPGSSGYIKLPAPSSQFRQFSHALVSLCKELQIERVIPTSDEVFWLSAVKGLPGACTRMLSPLAILGFLHSKKTFSALASQLGYGPGFTRVLRSKEELEDFAGTSALEATVLRPIYPGRVSEALVSPSSADLVGVRPSVERPWLAQSREFGREVCLYNTAYEGKLISHVAYLPRWRAGSGASLYFEPVICPRLEELSAKVIAATNFTGQISFEVIETAAGPVALKCKPKGTSGAHLAVQNLAQFGAALLGEVVEGTLRPSPAMLALPHAIHNAATLRTATGRRAWRAASDALHQAGVPLWAQVLASAELLGRSVGAKPDALTVAMSELNWDGELIGV